MTGALTVSDGAGPRHRPPTAFPADRGRLPTNRDLASVVDRRVGYRRAVLEGEPIGGADPAPPRSPPTEELA